MIVAAAPPLSAPESPIPELAVIVPVRNEQDNVLPLIEEIHAALEGHGAFEVIYVDDGSTDATPHRLKAARDRFPRLRTVRHRTSCGQSQAVATGVRLAGAPWIATIDGDGQNDPADIPRLVAALRAAGPEAGRTLVAGHRRKRQDTRIKRISSRIANRVRAALLHDDTPDSGCGLKVFARESFLDLPRFDHMHRFLPALMLRAGGRVVSVAVNHRPRERGCSNYGLWDRLWVGLFDLAGVMWLQHRAINPDIEPDQE
ncbi:MAG: glycosyltransferase family 2 protein [Alphaproteobacteria bacterium]|nr:glycosyltransferase family 2 protein [Alphaproteobacteria bacterium]